tara:strand:- start:6055 stop:7194 length:1140 start_codon:yes stop_codon:yes gene_type:complete
MKRSRRNGEIQHGFIGKFKTYKKLGFKDVPDLSTEEKQAELLKKMKPWSFDPKKVKTKFGFVESGSVGPTPTPVTPTPTPTNEPTPTPTPTSSSTPTPTPTPSATPPPACDLTYEEVSSFDPDAAAYLADVLTAGGTLDATISGATETLFTELKSEGLYNEIILMYLFLGGTAGSCSIMADRTSGTTYDLTYINSPTFSSDGYKGNGTNTGANTHFPADSQPTSRFNHIYVSGDDDFKSYLCGGGGGNQNNIILDFGSNNTGYFGYGSQNTWSPIGTTFQRQNGNLIGSLVAATSLVAYQDEVQVISAGAVSNANQNRYLSIGCDNRTNIPGFGGNSANDTTNGTIKSYAIGNDLTPAQCVKFSELINDFQTTLGRNNY